jgi:anti-sigma factor RsiW
MESKLSGHWTNEQLIEHLYGVAADQHLDACPDCQARLSSMQARRQAVETNSSEDDASFEVLAAQRRRIYARLSEPRPFWSDARLRRWASAAAMIAVLGGGFLVYEDHKQQVMDNKISDAQLAQEVSSMAQESEPQPTAPLQVLFEE